MLLYLLFICNQTAEEARTVTAAGMYCINICFFFLNFVLVFVVIVVIVARDIISRIWFNVVLAGSKPGFWPGLQPGFRQVRAGLRHAFDMLSRRFRLFLSKTWSRTCCINLNNVEIDAAGSQQVRWFERMLDKWNVEKPVSSQPTNLLKLDFRYVFHYSCLSWRN